MDNFNKNMADGLISELGGLLQKAESLMSSIPDKAKEAIPSAQIDISSTREKMRQGDSNAISDIMKKYSNPSGFTMRKM